MSIEQAPRRHETRLRRASRRKPALLDPPGQRERRSTGLVRPGAAPQREAALQLDHVLVEVGPGGIEYQVNAIDPAPAPSASYHDRPTIPITTEVTTDGYEFDNDAEVTIRQIEDPTPEPVASIAPSEPTPEPVATISPIDPIDPSEASPPGTEPPTDARVEPAPLPRPATRARTETPSVYERVAAGIAEDPRGGEWLSQIIIQMNRVIGSPVDLPRVRRTNVPAGVSASAGG